MKKPPLPKSHLLLASALVLTFVFNMLLVSGVLQLSFDLLGNPDGFEELLIVCAEFPFLLFLCKRNNRLIIGWVASKDSDQDQSEEEKKED